MRRGSKAAALAAAVLVLTGALAWVLEPVPHADERVVERLADAYAINSAGRIRATELSDKRIDRLYAFAPGAAPRTIARAVGVQIRELPRTRVRDDETMLILLANHSVIDAIRIPQSSFDLSCLASEAPEGVHANAQLAVRVELNAEGNGTRKVCRF